MDNRARSQRKLVGAAAESLAQSALGLTFAFSVLIGFGIGYGLDHLCHTAPWLMLTGLLLGVVAAFISLFRAARPKGNAGCSSKD